MKKSDFYFDLPQDLIAQKPATPRDSSRLLHYENETIYEKHFYDLPDILKKGDVLVMNNTKVLPARILGKKRETNAKIEFLLLKRINLTDWEVLVKPSKRLSIGGKVDFSSDLYAEIIGEGEEGERKVKFYFEGVFEDILDRIGQMPLPPYIREKNENERYQTVYALNNGSSAAPTAGLHFTTQLLEKIRAKGVEIVEVLLHIGLGTFRPVKTDNILEHKMHSEYFEISQEACDKINLALKENRRIIAVGTTSIRVLESACDQDGILRALKGETNIFIYPPYKFKVIKGIITNFHLPESTLIMLISAFLGRETTLNLYKYAIENRYRFFSFGDSMILL